MAAFPFKAAKLRPAEPPRPTDEYLLRSIHDMTDEEAAVGGRYLAWIEQQPDAPLWNVDQNQRWDWTYLRGKVSQEKLEKWIRRRYEVAELIRRRGFGDYLDKYWPDNDELRREPPGFVFPADLE